MIEKSFEITRDNLMSLRGFATITAARSPAFGDAAQRDDKRDAIHESDRILQVKVGIT
jgi:hypothetical protein